MKEIPLVDLKAGFAPIKNEVMHAVEDVLTGMHLNIGPNCRSLEDEFAAYCGVKHAVGVGSGTEAIQFALLACGVGEGDEVITSPHTFFATAEAICCIGASPVFVDIDPLTYTISPEAIEKRITKKTKAIIPVHMYGQCADMSAVNNIAQGHGIAVVEDACQAHGARYHDKKSGSLGNAGCFSFYFTKNLGAYGEGGIVTTNDVQLAEKVRLYRNHGHKSKYEHAVIGYNGRIDEIQAAILRIKLRHLEEYNSKRRVKADFYNSFLKDTPLVLPAEKEGRTHVYHLYVVRSKERDRLQDFLRGKGIQTGIHYRNPIHLQEATAFLGYKKGDIPGVEKACEEILSLPIYPELEEESQAYVAEMIEEFYS
ncbi:Pleiotropic regulatory protein [Candidatus Sulfobium mesophilum]|uniref:Pleiotropic regulatory protein n=1 Tax=Candidatus Sulfobium mesophilum TaxID=2016548 RepID=A0A2U3QF59_9BACT|nr:Pleiotropic regulatory protein [Candidatus Sulfobium mesophilum]